ncbi:MAG: endonuclease domain-containing protein [Candidatus Gracilibacteria bacterium]|nr:endonuclease domain-containing protein [Candidatus Gracilibacteria bacterium]
MYIVPNNIIEIGRKLRLNMTESEKKIWNELRNKKLGVKFLRQNPMYVFTENNGLNRFIIPDFYCKEKNLILEIDGNIHNLEEVLELDLEKEKLVNNLGIKVIRIKNEDILNNLYNVLNKIKIYL